MHAWKRTFALVWLNNFITAMGMMAFLPLLPLYLRELGVRDPGAVRLWSGLLVAGAPLTAAFMGPVWGAIGDRVGRKPMMVRANVAITLFVGGMSLVTAPLQLLALRLLQGVFSGFMAPSVTLVSVMTPPERQGRVTGLLHTAVIAGSLCGPVVGGALADQVGFRAVFVACAALSACAALMTSLAVREPPPARPREAGALRPLALMRSVLDDFATFLAPGPLRTVLICVFAVRFGAATVDPVLALYIETLAGVPPDLLATTTGLVFGATAAATLLLTPIWGRVGDHRGHGTLLIACAGGAGLFYGLQGLVTSVTPLYLLRFCSGACVAGIFPAAYAMAARHSAPERRGGALGLTFSSIVLANALGPATGGLIAAALGLRPLFFLAAALMVGSAARTLLARRAAAVGEPTDGPVRAA